MLAWWLSSVSPSLARERGFRSDRWEQHVNDERIRYLAAGETGGGLNIASAKPSPVVHVRRDICTIHFDEWSKVACGAATDAEDAETARLVKEWTAMSWNSSVLAREVDMLQWLNHICNLTEDLQLHARAANSIATKRLHDEGMDLSRGPSIYRQWRNLDGNIETGLNAEIEGAAGDDKFSFEARIWLNDIDLLLNGCLLQKNGDWDPWPPAYTADVQGVLVRAAAIGIHENLSVREKEKEHLADFPQPSYDRWLHMDREAQRIALCNDELSRALYALWLDAMATSDTCPISHRVPREPAADACDSHFEREYIKWVDGVLEDLNAHTEAHVSGESMDPLVLEAHEKEPEELLAWRTLITMENGLRAEGGLERTRTESNFDLWIQTLQIDHNIHCPDPALQFQVLQREVSSPSPGASTRDAESILSAWRDAASEGSSPEGLSVVEHLNELAGDENASIVKDGKEEPYVKVVEEDDLVVGANGVSRPTSVPFEEVLKEVEELVDVMEFEAVFARTENVEPGARLEEEFASETHSSAGSNADTWSNLRGRSDETKNSGSDFQVSSSRAASFYDAEICQEFLIPTESDEQSEIEDQMAETLSLDESKEGEVAFRPEERRAIVLPGLAREMTEFLNLPVVEMELLSDMAAAEREEEIFTETISFSRDGEVTEVEESVVTKHEKSDHRSVGTVADHENHSEPARVQGRRVAKQFASIGIQTGTASMEDAEASSTLLERNKKPVESTKKQSSRLSTSSVHFSSSSPKNMSPRETELPPSSPKVAPVSHRQKKVKDMKVRDSHAVKKKAAKKSIARLEELDFSDLDDFDFKSGLRDFDADEHVVLSTSVASPRAQQKHEKRSKEPFHTLVSPPEAEESKRQAAAIESTQVRMRVLEETVTANWSPRPGKHKLTSPRADEIASRKATGTGFLASDNSPKAALMRQSTHSAQLQQKGSFGSDQPILEQDMRNAAFSRERVDTVMTTASEFDALGGLSASVSRTFEPPNGDSSIGLSDYVRVANEATFSSKDLHAARSTCRCLRYPFRLPERSVQNLIISQRYGKQLGKSHTQASRQPPPEDSDFSGMWGRQYIASSTILRAETSKEVQEVNTGSQMDTSKLSLKDKLNDEDHTHQMKKKKEASAFAEGKSDPQLDSVQRSLTRSKTQERYSSTSRSGTAIPNRSRTRKTGVEAAPVLVFSPRDAKGGERSVTDRAKQYQHSVSRAAPHSLISPRGKSILSPRSEPQELNHMTKQIPGPQHAVTCSDSVRSSATSDFDSELYARTYTKFTGRNETGRLLTHEEFSGASGASGPSIMRSSLLVPVGGRGMTAAGGGEFSSNLARGWSSCTVGGNLMPRQNRDLVSRPSCQSSTQLTNLADLDSDPVLVAVHFHRGEVVVLSRTSLVVYSSGGQQRILDILIEPQGSLVAGMMLQLEDELWAVSSMGTVYAVNTVRGSIRSVDLLSDADRANGVRVTSICFVGENSDIFLVGFSHGVASMASRLSFESHCQILPRAEHLTARVEHVASAWIEATPHVSTVCIGYSDGYVRCVRVENQGSNIAVSEMSTFLVSASSLLGLVLLFEGSVVVTLSAGQRGSMVSCFNSVDGSICGSETTSSKGFCLSTIDFLNRCTVCPSANMLLIGGSHGSVEVLRVSPVSSQRTVLKRSFKIQSHAIGGVAAGKSKQLRHASVKMKKMTLSTSRIAYDPVNQIIYALTMERQVLRWGISGPDAVLLATPNSCGTQRHMDVQLPMYPIDLLWNDFVALRHITLEQETRLLDPIRDLQAQFAGLLERLSSPLFVLPDSVKLSDVGSMSFDRCLEEFDRLVARGFEGEKHVREKYEKIYPGRGSQTQQSHPSSLMSGLGDAAISLHRTRLELLSTYAQRSMAYEIYYVRESAITSIRDFEQRERLGLSSLLKHIVEDAKCSPKVRSETLAMVAQFSGTIQAP
ncbi:hypothetical protein FVE85_7399 [Porphyridium purpureum]|uniref:Uncharacterized protein n=1 Tax=Porphyridium purpureum TaxID=35688 RepID=A0A5J4Z9X9_PORPP|nr:hypothetical protein FVE85_7399 [Porphyridium purpureum]|eukprot:POR2739..scf295_1